jgi:hypothetical protein
MQSLYRPQVRDKGRKEGTKGERKGTKEGRKKRNEAVVNSGW